MAAAYLRQHPNNPARFAYITNRIGCGAGADGRAVKYRGNHCQRKPSPPKTIADDAAEMRLASHRGQQWGAGILRPIHPVF